MHPQTPSHEDPLVALLRARQIVIIASENHQDQAVAEYLAKQIPQMKKAGARYFFVEADPKSATVGTLVNQPHGDTRAISTILSATYDTGLVHYLVDDWNGKNGVDVQSREMVVYRNERMAENIWETMRYNQRAKAIILVGADHIRQPNDLDERLREKGLDAVVATVISNSRSEYKTAAKSEDVPDILVKVTRGWGEKKGVLSAYKTCESLSTIEHIVKRDPTYSKVVISHEDFCVNGPKTPSNIPDNSRVSGVPKAR